MFYAFLIIFIIIIFFFGKNIFANFSVLDFISSSPKETQETAKHPEEQPVIQKAQQEEVKKQQEANKINVLILGKGGGNHDAPNLTDTIILASFDQEKKAATLLSIPRDFYVKYPNGVPGKINKLYSDYYDLYLSHEKAVSLLQDKITQVTGQKIDYYAMIDFQSFVEVVDVLGGVEVTLETNLYDEQYPDGNGGYTTFLLRKGTWTLDGEVALKYVRSRHSTSDFDRSVRQQKVLSSLKKKLSELGVFSDLGKMKDLYFSFQENVETNFGLKDFLKFSSLASEKISLQTFHLNDSCSYPGAPCEKGGLLYTPLREYFGGASILLPQGAQKGDLENYDSLQEYFSLLFEHQEIYDENIQINIFNATSQIGLAGDFSKQLVPLGFNIPSLNGIGNARDKQYLETTVFYDAAIENTKTLQYLKSKYNFTYTPLELMPLYSRSDKTQIEFVLAEDFIEQNK